MPASPIAIYCAYRQPGGVERVSLRLRDLFGRSGRDGALLSRGGDRLYGVATGRPSRAALSGRPLVFSRKSDLADLGPRTLLARRLVYWRHIPLPDRGHLKRGVEIAFLAALSRLGRVACVCDELTEEVRALPLVARARVHTCHAPLGRAAAPVPIRPIAAPHRPSLVYFGRESAQKRLADVIALVAAARAEGLDVTLRIFGYAAPPAGVPPAAHVRFEGRTDDPLAVLAASDGLILLSRFEGFPTALVEAAAAGAPIFCNAFRTGLRDFERLIGPTGRIDPDDPGSLARALRAPPAGTYRLDRLADDEVLAQWRTVLD